MSKKRTLLAILDTNPFPATDGKTYPIEGQLGGLSRWWDIDILEVRKTGVRQGFESGTHRELARNVFQVEAPTASGKAVKLSGELLSGRPYFLQPTASRQAIQNAVGEHRYDAIYISPLGLADWATQVANCLAHRPKLILNQNDSITERFRRDYDLFKMRVLSWKNSAKHLLQSLRASYMAAMERRIYSSFDLILVQTDKDRDVIIDDVGGDIRSKLVVAANGIKPSLLTLNYQQQHAKRLLHIGGLSRNRRDLVFWFLKEVFLPVKNEIPDMTIQLAGSMTDADQQSLATMPGVEPLGFVQDVKEVFSNATMSVAPLFMRSGLVNKVLDSMAAGVPSSGTRAFNGFPGFQDGIHGFDVADAQQWKAVLLQSLQDPGMLNRVSEAGRHLVSECLRWETTVERIHAKMDALFTPSTADEPTPAPDESLVA